VIDLAFNHKLLNETIWILIIISSSLAIVTTVICALLCFIQLFLTLKRQMNIPKSIFLWNVASGIFILLAIFLFAFQYKFYIQNNVLTQQEIDNGWISTNLAELSWSFYILLIPFSLIFFNLFLIYGTFRLKRSFVDLKSEYDSIQNANKKTSNRDLNLIKCINSNAISLDDNKIHEFYDARIQTSYFTFNLTGSSNRLKKIIDLIY
jgi:hypothetical protein